MPHNAIWLSCSSAAWDQLLWLKDMLLEDKPTDWDHLFPGTGWWYDLMSPPKSVLGRLLESCWSGSKVGCLFFLWSRQHGIISRYPSMKVHFIFRRTSLLLSQTWKLIHLNHLNHPVEAIHSGSTKIVVLLARPLTFQSFLQSVSLKAWLPCFGRCRDKRKGCPNCTTDLSELQYIHSVPRSPTRSLKFTCRHVVLSCIILPTCWSSWLFTSWRCWRWSFGHWWMFGGAFQRQTWGQCQHWMNIWDEQR